MPSLPPELLATAPSPLKWVEAKLRIANSGKIPEGWPNDKLPGNSFRAGLAFFQPPDQLVKTGTFPVVRALPYAKHDFEHLASLTDTRGNVMEALNVGFWKAVCQWEGLPAVAAMKGLYEQFQGVTLDSLLTKQFVIPHYNTLADTAQTHWLNHFKQDGMGKDPTDRSLTFTGHLMDRFNSLHQVLNEPKRPAMFEYGYCPLPTELDTMEAVTNQILADVTRTPDHPPMTTDDLWASGSPLEEAFLRRFNPPKKTEQ